MGYGIKLFSPGPRIDVTDHLAIFTNTWAGCNAGYYEPASHQWITIGLSSPAYSPSLVTTFIPRGFVILFVFLFCCTKFCWCN